MLSPDDTIVAIATAEGRGGIGVIRISGPRAIEVSAGMLERREPLVPRHATFSRIRRPSPAGHSHATAAIDDVVATLFAAPGSYTGQDVVEISAHGSPVVLQAIVRAAMDGGARLAEPGEFTLRAFLAGKLDLVQAEAVADLVAAATPLQAATAYDQLAGTLTARIAEIDSELFDLIAKLEASIDFPDEGFHFIEPEEIAARVGVVIDRLDRLLADAARGRMIRDGATVVIAGRPNVGKSSLFNALCGADRAIVTALPGTTRDLVTERVDVHGLAVTLVDTAGVREAGDAVEREGVSRGARARSSADLVLLLMDLSGSLTEEDGRILDETSGARRLVVGSKLDAAVQAPVPDAIAVSVKTGAGLDELRAAIALALTGGKDRDAAAISNLRHVELLDQARGYLARAQAAARDAGAPEEILLADLHDARICFDEVVGRRSSDDVLRHIFERFCIGK